MEIVRDPDAELIEACRNPEDEGFEQAFEALFLRYRDRVYAIAFRITGSTADALDVVQEAFGLVFRKLSGFRFHSLFSTWLFRVVVNCSIDLRRREKSRAWQRKPLELTDEPEAEATEAGPEAAAVTQELGDQVQAAIQLLSPKLRAVLALRYLEDMSYEELAATLGLSLGTVKSRLARAHLAFERLVRERFPHLDRAQTADPGDSVGRRGGP